MLLFQRCVSTRASNTSRTRRGRWDVNRSVSAQMLRWVPTDASHSKSTLRRTKKEGERRWTNREGKRGEIGSGKWLLGGREGIVCVFFVCCLYRRRNREKEKSLHSLCKEYHVILGGYFYAYICWLHHLVFHYSVIVCWYNYSCLDLSICQTNVA